MKKLIILFLIFATHTTSLLSDPVNYEKVESLPPNTKIEIKSLARDVMNFIRWRNLKIAKMKLQKIEKIHSRNEEFFYLRGAIAYSERRFEDSIQDLLMAIEIHPEHDPALFLTGVNFAHLRDWNKSADYFVRSVSHAPYSPYYQLNCAYAYFLLEDNDNAKKHLELSLAQKPNFDNAIILARHMGDTRWEEEFKELSYISKDTIKYLEEGFPDQTSKEDYFLERIYSFFPILR